MSCVVHVFAVHGNGSEWEWHNGVESQDDKHNMALIFAFDELFTFLLHVQLCITITPGLGLLDDDSICSASYSLSKCDLNVKFLFCLVNSFE